MSRASIPIPAKRPLVVGSFGSAAALRAATREALATSCDLAEIRLDLLLAETGEIRAADWQHLAGFPLLFTARRAEEGGTGNLSAHHRTDLLRRALPDAALVDIEVASIAEMDDLLSELGRHDIPWVASFHDFSRLPQPAAMESALARAAQVGAAVFKLAARLHRPADAARLAEFQLAAHGLPVATMGMGPLAPVSRLLCAQCGSQLNYGYLGDQPTAPGQWSAARLRDAISALAPIGPGDAD